MVLVAVSEEDGAELGGVVEDVRHVGDDDVDAEGGGIGKHHAAVDDDGVAAALVDHEVHPDLAEPAEGEDAQSFVHRGRCITNEGVGKRRPSQLL